MITINVNEPKTMKARSIYIKKSIADILVQEEGDGMVFADFNQITDTLKHCFFIIPNQPKP